MKPQIVQQGAFVPSGIYDDLTVGYAKKSEDGVDIDEEFTEIDGRLDNIENGTQDIAYNNTTSGLTATTVKGAIDEIEANKVDKTLIVDNVTTNDATKSIECETR